ncbi:hypothetical protein TKK_0003786 [Trichogramma kaykai]|uniref:TROVE domain-containing protein n=1 Tax=Trichogramma kaykai TaxID=54128 RepID=A0ABD2XN60_9HYME
MNFVLDTYGMLLNLLLVTEQQHQNPMPDFNDTALETQLRRFLYLGKEGPEYQPGNWFVHNYFVAENLPSVYELAENPLKHDVVISLILEAKENKLVQNPETLIFALAVCAQQDKSQELKKKAYDAVKKLCTTAEEFILFVKFCSHISKHKIQPKNGWGHGWRRAVKEWYLTKSPMTLAKIVTEGLHRYGWGHKDILKLAHMKVSNPDLEAVCCYILKGFKGLMVYKEENGLSPEAEEVFKYIESIEDFKHCEDEVRGAALIETLNLNLNHVPGHFLKSMEVWDSLLISMSLTTLLKNLQRIHNMGFLSKNNALTNKVLDILCKKNVEEEKIHPAQLYIALKNYENSGKPLTFEKRKIREQAKRPIPPPPEPNKMIIEKLKSLFNFSFECLEATNVNYMITISTNKNMENSCWKSGHVKAIEAAQIIALSILKTEKIVTLARFEKEGITLVETDGQVSMAQLKRKLETSYADIFDANKPMTLAADSKKVVDVFINIVDQIHPKAETSEEGIRNYRAKSNLPNAKLINVTLCATASNKPDFCDKNCLTICGFDGAVPRVIEAFARSYF